MTSLRSIVYVSTAVAGTTPEQLEQILLTSRRLNRQAEVTGVLLHHAGTFMQCLEGPEPAVLSTFERIRASKQHTGIVELLNEPVARRSFAQWAMGSVEPTGSQFLALSTARWKADLNAAHGADEGCDGLSMLRDFWTSARRGPD